MYSLLTSSNCTRFNTDLNNTMKATLVYGEDGIYRSPRPPISLPKDPNCSMIPFLFRRFSSLCDSPALTDAQTGRTLTFSDLKTQVYVFAKALTDLKISRDDVVLIFSHNSILFPIAFFSIISIGAIATTINPQYTVNEISKQIKDSNPKLIITVHDLYDKIKQFNLPCVMLSSPDDSSRNPAWIYYSDMISGHDASRFRLPEVSQDDAAAILYSSGTTGTSKGAVLTHRNFISAALMVTSDQEARGDRDNVFLCFLPMFHIFALSVVIYAPLQRGSSVVVMDKYDMERMLSALERYKVTHLCAVPPVVISLVKEKELVRGYDVSSLREMASGAAPIGKEIIEECAKVFPRAVLFQGYGMTETCGAISQEDSNTASFDSGSAGLLSPGIEARIVDLATMKPLAPLNRGEIWVRGPNIMRGYFKNQKATEETLDDQGWLHTGDLGYFDNDGRLYVVDRVKELIKYKGFQVAPAELEELLLAHPEIKDAAVIGFPDAEAGEIPIAYVVRSPVSSLTEEDIKDFIGQQVARFKRLRRVIFSDAIPKSASGKILRRELKSKLPSKL